MKIIQCYSCLISTLFQLYGQMEDYYQKEKDTTDQFIDKIKKDSVIDCLMCGVKVKYIQTGGTWIEKIEE